VIGNEEMEFLGIFIMVDESMRQKYERLCVCLADLSENWR